MSDLRKVKGNVGRPRKYNDAAEKQLAYRRRLQREKEDNGMVAALAVELVAAVKGAYDAGESLACDVISATDEGILRNLIAKVKGQTVMDFSQAALRGEPFPTL